MMAIRDQIRSGLKFAADFAADQWHKLSFRERMIVSSLGLFLVIVVLYNMYVPVSSAFASQSKRLAEVEQTLTGVAAALTRYSLLKQRQTAIENAYREIEIKEGVLSHLENLVKVKAGLSSGFTIKEKFTRQFGGSFEQTQHNIKFAISDYPRLVEFLKELVSGERPLILASFDLKKRPAGDSLDVDIDVTSIRRTK